MLLLLLLLIPLVGILIISASMFYNLTPLKIKQIKFIALSASIVNLVLSLIIYILFDFSSKQFQFVQEYHQVNYFDFYLGIDGLSIYFVLLTVLIMPISLLSNWTSIKENVRSFIIIILLLETLLLAVFLVLDILLFYIFFESILPPLFILIGLHGSSNRVRASFYFFLYTLLGSLFMLLSIITMSSVMGTTDFDALSKDNFKYFTQLFLFYGIFIAFAVKTPTIFLNSWLLKAHVESPLSGSIILAGIVLKLSLYGIFRLILPLLPKAYINYTYIIYLVGVITIIYASISTLRTIDVKELIAYSSVSHAAVYLLGAFSNTIQGIEGGIILGLAHGFVSSGLFICAGGVLYDRSSTRLITYYRGIAQIMPIFSILFFLLCLGNCGVPLTLNFIGEFMSLYGVFERLPILGILASSSIIFSAAYTIFMFNRIAFGGALSKYFLYNIPDLNKREFVMLLTLIGFTIILGIYPAPVLDGLHYSVSSLIYSTVLPMENIYLDAPVSVHWDIFIIDNNTSLSGLGITITLNGDYLKISYSLPNFSSWVSSFPSFFKFNNCVNTSNFSDISHSPIFLIGKSINYLDNSSVHVIHRGHFLLQHTSYQFMVHWVIEHFVYLLPLVTTFIYKIFTLYIIPVSLINKLDNFLDKGKNKFIYIKTYLSKLKNTSNTIKTSLITKDFFHSNKELLLRYTQPVYTNFIVYPVRSRWMNRRHGHYTNDGSWEETNSDGSIAGIFPPDSARRMQIIDSIYDVEELIIPLIEELERYRNELQNILLWNEVSLVYGNDPNDPDHLGLDVPNNMAQSDINRINDRIIDLDLKIERLSERISQLQLRGQNLEQIVMTQSNYRPIIQPLISRINSIVRTFSNINYRYLHGVNLDNN